MIEIPRQIETERLVIRAPQPGDGLELNRAVVESFSELERWMPWAKVRPTLEESEANIMGACANWDDHSDLRLLIFLKGSDELVASSGLHRIDWDVPRFEIGYWQRTRFCGHGYVTEAVRGIAELAFETLNAMRVEIRCDGNNEASRRVAERAGFPLEATLRNEMRDVHGILRDTLIFARLGKETP